MGHAGKYLLVSIYQSIYTNLIEQVHVDQVSASPIHFDPKTKTACYSVQMDPVTIKTMFDHKRSIHCSLLRKKLNKYQSFDENGLVITLEKGMTEGKPIQVNIKNKSCQVHAALTRLPYLQNEFVQPVKSIAPTPLTYTLQITQLSLPLSTLAA